MKYSHPTQIPKSDVIKGLRWTGKRSPISIKGIHGDTYPMSWAADDAMYASSGDPNWAFFDGVPRHVPWAEAIDNPDLYPHTGGLDIEKIDEIGTGLALSLVNTMPGFIGPGGLGAKPSGLICVDGVLYLAAQNLLGKKDPPRGEKSQHGTDASLFMSKDLGKSWTPDVAPILLDLESKKFDRRKWVWLSPPEERQSWNGWTPMFPGYSFGGPSFVQFGKNNADAVDDYVYVVSGDQWDNGSELRLARVPKDRIMQLDAWAWANMDGSGAVTWVDRQSSSKPVLTIDKHVSLPEMIYLTKLKRYLLLTWALHKDFNVSAGSELTILEAENPWGPFRLVHFEEIWDEVDVCPYCPRVPLKWFDQDKLSGWLLHSGNWTGTTYYMAHNRPFELIV